MAEEKLGTKFDRRGRTDVQGVYCNVVRPRRLSAAERIESANRRTDGDKRAAGGAALCIVERELSTTDGRACEKRSSERKTCTREIAVRAGAARVSAATRGHVVATAAATWRVSHVRALRTVHHVLGRKIKITVVTAVIVVARALHPLTRQPNTALSLHHSPSSACFTRARCRSLRASPWCPFIGAVKLTITQLLVLQLRDRRTICCSLIPRDSMCRKPLQDRSAAWILHFCEALVLARCGNTAKPPNSSYRTPSRGHYKTICPLFGWGDVCDFENLHCTAWLNWITNLFVSVHF